MINNKRVKLGSGKILLGDANNKCQNVTLTGDLSISSAGVATLSSNLRTGYIPLDITTARLISANNIQNTTEAGVPDGNTTPTLLRVNGATDKALRLTYAATVVTEIQFSPFVYPPDLDDTQSLNINILAAMSGATDTPVLTVSFFEGTGDTDAGGNTTAVTGTNPAVYARNIGAADINPGRMANISITPGAHGTDSLYIYGVYVTYSRKS